MLQNLILRFKLLIIKDYLFKEGKYYFVLIMGVGKAPINIID